MKKPTLILIMGLCGSFAFAQDADTKAVKSNHAEHSVADEKAPNEVSSLSMIDKKKLKATKVMLPADALMKQESSEKQGSKPEDE